MAPVDLSYLRIYRGAKARVDVSLNVQNMIEINADSRLFASNQITASTLWLITRSSLDANTINAAASFQISDSSVVSHLATTGSVLGKLLLTTGTLTIDATSRIDVSARGFLGGRQPGNSLASTGSLAGFFPGMTVGFQAGSTGRTGAGYGGLGGAAEIGTVNPIYGLSTDPNDPGSGGAAGSTALGGNGGGQIRIVATTMQLDGVIKADGGNGFIDGGGGSGGGIRIDTMTLSGTGQITAAGGNGPFGGGGGGGRIAVYYQTNSGFNFGLVTATGGLGGGGRPNGNTGTVHLQQQIAGLMPLRDEAPANAPVMTAQAW